MATDADIVQRGWDAVARGDWDALVADYVEDMIYVKPGQTSLESEDGTGLCSPTYHDIPGDYQEGDILV